MVWFGFHRTRTIWQKLTWIRNSSTFRHLEKEKFLWVYFWNYSWKAMICLSFNFTSLPSFTSVVPTNLIKIRSLSLPPSLPPLSLSLPPSFYLSLSSLSLSLSVSLSLNTPYFLMTFIATSDVDLVHPQLSFSVAWLSKRDFLEMEASLWLNGRSQNVAKGWLST